MARDQEMVANLGFFDQEEEAANDAQLSQSQTVEESKDQHTEDNVKRHPAESISKEELEAKFSEEDKLNVQKMFN